jgi:branched-chain amino acid aminotransferase
MSDKDVNTKRLSPKIWHNGDLINWNDARVHVMTHAIHYGSSVFEGIRCYDGDNGPAVFRLDDHMKRLVNSAKIYRMDIDFTCSDFVDATVNLIRVSGLDECYIRPIIFRGLDEENPAFGVNPFPNPLESYIALWEWGKYLGEEALENGIDVCVSSWARFNSNALPAMAKAGANYMNSQLIKMEAILTGYSEGIALDDRGYVSEGSGENLFIVNNGKLITPPLGASILPGITRDTVIKLAKELGIEAVETTVQRAALYLADELFFSGTAAEITPIRSVDKITVGKGKRGPITAKLQEEYFKLIRGQRPAPDNADWLTYVNETSEKKSAAGSGCS